MTPKGNPFFNAIGASSVRLRIPPGGGEINRPDLSGSHPDPPDLNLIA